MPYARHRPDQGKAAALVVVLHLALGAALISGLGVDTVRRAAESLKSYDVRPPEPELPVPPPTVEQAAARQQAAPPNLRSKPLPQIAPTPLLPLPAPAPAAEVSAPQAGRDLTAGAAEVAGPGTGAGGSGDGYGGGGSGGSGAGGGAGGEVGAPARLLRGMRSRLDESFLRGFPAHRGEAILSLTIGTDGRVVGCQVAQGTGSDALDAELCSRMASRSRWEPARDQAGRPMPVTLRYTAVWSRS